MEDSLLNCSTGPIGPLSFRNQYHKFPPLFHEGVYNHNNDKIAKDQNNGGQTNQKPAAKSHWRPSTPSSQAVNQNNWQKVTSTTKTTEDLISVSRDLRQALNRRCSGMTNGRICSFNLQLDHEESQLWGSGLVDIFYRCVPKRTVENTCSPLPSSTSDSYSSYSRTYKVDFFHKIL